jgi:GxxExxY protein
LDRIDRILKGLTGLGEDLTEILGCWQIWNLMKTKFDDPLSRKVIGCAMAVHRELGFGFLESVFHRALELELAAAGMEFESEKRMNVFYRGKVVGHFVADLVVEGSLVVELKAVETVVKAHEVQLVNYLTAANIDHGLLINFGTESLGVRRKFKRSR